MPTSPRGFRLKLERALAGIRWRQWSALGVAAQVEPETGWLVDLEALVVSTLGPASADRRLRELARAWLAANDQWLNHSRLGRIEREFAGAGLEPGATGERPASSRKVAPPELLRPALGQLALRALLGMDARAEVYLYLRHHIDGNSNSIARAVRCDQKSAYRVLERWHAAGVVRKTAAGWALARDWRGLAPAGPGPEPRYLDWTSAFKTLDRLALGLAGTAAEDAYIASSLFRDHYAGLAAIARAADVELPAPGPYPGAQFFVPFAAAVLALLAVLGAQ